MVISRNLPGFGGITSRCNPQIRDSRLRDVDYSLAVLSETQGIGLVIHQVIRQAPCLSRGKRNEPELPAKGLKDVANCRQ